jgi:hypothetical protein
MTTLSNFPTAGRAARKAFDQFCVGYLGNVIFVTGSMTVAGRW